SAARPSTSRLMLTRRSDPQACLARTSDWSLKRPVQPCWRTLPSQPTGGERVDASQRAQEPHGVLDIDLGLPRPMPLDRRPAAVAMLLEDPQQLGEVRRAAPQLHFGPATGSE